jgi:hypothetical protein
MTYPDHVKLLAALAFARANGDAALAEIEFLSFCSTLDIEAPGEAAAFIKKWGPHWEKHANVVGNASNSGRKRKLPDGQVETLMGEILGWKQAGMKGPYRSVAELLENSTVAAEIVSNAGVSHDTVIRRLKEKNPNLQYLKLGVKPSHTQRQLDDRYFTAAAHLEEPASVRERVVFIDAKTMYMKINSRSGWVDVTVEDTFSTPFPASMKSPMALKYYIAVNHKMGKVLLVFYTGTTGMPANRDPNSPYLVGD